MTRVAVRGQHRGRPITSIAVAYSEPAPSLEPDWNELMLESLEPELDVPAVAEPAARPSLLARVGTILRRFAGRLRAAARAVVDRLPRPRLPRLRRDRDPIETETVVELDAVPETAEQLAALYIDHLEQTLNLELSEELRMAAFCRAMFETAIAISPEPPSDDELLGLRWELLLGFMRPELAEVDDLDLPNDPVAVTEWAEQQLLWPLLDKFDVWAEMAANLQPKE